MLEKVIGFFNEFSISVWQFIFNIFSSFSMYFPKNQEEIKTILYLCGLNEQTGIRNAGCQIEDISVIATTFLFTLFLVMCFGIVAMQIFLKSQKIKKVKVVFLSFLLLCFAFIASVINGGILSMKYELKNIYYTDGYFMHTVILAKENNDVRNNIEEYKKLSKSVYSRPYDLDMIANVRNNALAILLKGIYFIEKNDIVQLKNEITNIKSLEKSFPIVKNEIKNKSICKTLDYNITYYYCQKRINSYIIQTENDINFVKNYLNAKLSEMDKNYNIALEYYKQINENYSNYSLPIKKFISKTDLYVAMKTLATQMKDYELAKIYHNMVSLTSFSESFIQQGKNNL